MAIRHEHKDATITNPSQITLIAHIVNDIGAWGAGFSGALERVYPGTGEVYKLKIKQHRLSQIFFTLPAPYVAVCHMVAQSGVRSRYNKVPLRYAELQECLYQLAHMVNRMNREGHKVDVIQLPKIGSGLAGGEWKRIEAIINETLAELDHDVDVIICDWP